MLEGGLKADGDNGFPENPFHDAGNINNAVGGGLEGWLCYTLDLYEETYPIRGDFKDETTRVKWDDEEVIQIVAWDDYNDEENFEILSLG